MDGIYILLAITVIFGPWILSIVALTKVSTATRLITQTQPSLDQALRQIAVLRSDLSRFQDQFDLADTAEPREQGETPPVEAVEEEQRPDGDRTEQSQISSESPSYARPWDRPPKAQPVELAAPLPAAPVSEPTDRLPVEKQSLEEVLTSRWMVWLGAVVIALGSVFLVKYAIDQGYLGPAARDSLTFLLGVSLVVGGEWLRRRPLQRAIAAIGPNYVPLALTASGLFAAFASIYAAHVLHGLLAPLLAFAGLAAIALVAVGLSLLQGRFVALLGLLGAFATPALIATPDPSLWTLFTYLLVIQAACLMVVRYQAWWSLGLATLLSATAWPIWIGSRLGWTDAEVAPLGFYLILTVGAFLLLRHRLASLDILKKEPDWFQRFVVQRPYDTLAWSAAIIVAVIVFGVVQAADFNTASLILLAALATFYLVVGRSTAVLEGFPVIAAAIVVGSMASWPQFGFVGQQDTFVTVSFVFGALFGLAGFVALWGAERPALWSAVSISVPLALLIIAYGLIADFTANPRWIVLALGLGAISLLAAARVVLYRTAYGLSLSLGLYAAGVVAFVTLAATMVLEQAWLTVALSVQLAALAWIYRHIPERSLEKIAAILAGAVLVRLIVNPNILDYTMLSTPLFSWVIYGYGVPALTFFWAAKLFRDAKLSLLVTLLQAGSLVFAVLVVSFEIRIFIAGSLDNPHYGLLEQSLHSITWLAIGTGLAIRHRRHPDSVALYGYRVLLLLAAAQIVFFQLLLSNPIHSRTFVGDTFLFDTLLLAYAVPAAFAFFLARWFQRDTPKWPAAVAAILGFVLIFVYLTLEVRHAYQGPVLSVFHQSDAEFYTYSLIWLIYALALLAVGIASKATLVRYVSLAVLLITVLKAFIFDMSDLSGLLRVSTFLILGLTLIGIGYLYQRFVFRVPISGAPGEEAVVDRQQ